jgi:hypothetical protein
MEEAGADTAALVRRTRDSGLQPDHVNEPDFDEKHAEGEDSVGDSAILSLTYMKLRKTHPEAFAKAMRRKRNKISRNVARQNIYWVGVRSNKISDLSG